MSDFIPEPYQFQMDEGISIGWQTSLGFNNCFSLNTHEGKSYNVVNFYLETLEKLLKAKEIDWPVKIAILAEKTCVINDPRIDEEHYNQRFCRVCCPMDLLPAPQRLETSRRIMDGTTSFSKSTPWKIGDIEMPEMIIESTTITAKKCRPAPDFIVGEKR